MSTGCAPAYQLFQYTELFSVALISSSPCFVVYLCVRGGEVGVGGSALRRTLLRAARHPITGGGGRAW